MKSALDIAPQVKPPLDPGYRPMACGNHAYRKAAASSPRRQPIAIALEREDGQISRFETEILPLDGVSEGATRRYLERLVKFLLWQRGGWRLVVGGPREAGELIRSIYSAGGARAFDHGFMGGVYERPFTVEVVSLDKVPPSSEGGVALGGHLDGCRIGFDLGASDYKIAAVLDGNPVYADEIPWDPKVQPDPQWHYRKINEGLKLAASKLPRVDAIGGSAAGIYIKNRTMVASLFRAVPKDLFASKVRPIFLRLAEEWKVPLEVANDGDVTALAGGMSLQSTAVLGLAMGSSEAVGYLNAEGKITGWLNELAFAPVDYSESAAIEEWSGDRGAGALYFSQQAVARLAPAAGIELPKAHQAEQLKFVQDLHKKGDPRAAGIFETIGVYLGYTIAYYSDMYDFRHLLVLGRVTSGRGGDVILERAGAVLRTEFPDLAERIGIHTPDERMKRVGQAVAAASLPVIPR